MPLIFLIWTIRFSFCRNMFFVITSVLHTHYILKEEKNPLDGIFDPFKQTNTQKLDIIKEA